MLARVGRLCVRFVGRFLFCLGFSILFVCLFILCVFLGGFSIFFVYLFNYFFGGFSIFFLYLFVCFIIFFIFFTLLVFCCFLGFLVLYICICLPFFRSVCFVASLRSLSPPISFPLLSLSLSLSLLLGFILSLLSLSSRIYFIPTPLSSSFCFFYFMSRLFIFIF